MNISSSFLLIRPRRYHDSRLISLVKFSTVPGWYNPNPSFHFSNLEYVLAIGLVIGRCIEWRASRYGVNAEGAGEGVEAETTFSSMFGMAAGLYAG